MFFGQLAQAGFLLLSRTEGLEQFQVGRRITAQAPAQHHAVRSLRRQVFGVLRHEFQYGNSRYDGHFPRGVHLYFGDGFQARLLGVSPVCERPRSRAYG